MSRWRLLVYELLTQAIVLLGAVRERLLRYQPQRRRLDRLFAVYQNERWTCCDCGADHDQVFTGPGGCAMHPYEGMVEVGHAWPIRPVGYSYRLRLGAARPSFAEQNGSAP